MVLQFFKAFSYRYLKWITGTCILKLVLVLEFIHFTRMVRVYFSCVKSNRGTSLYQWTIPPFHIEISSEFHFFQTLHVKSPY